MPSGTRLANAYVDLDYNLGPMQQTAKQAQAETATLGQQIKQALSSPAAFSGKSGIANLIADLKLGRGLLTSLRSAIPGVAKDLAGLGVSGLSKGLGGVLNQLKSLGGSVLKGLALGAGITGFLQLEQAIARVVKAIPDLINKGRDYANEVDQIVDVTGASTRSASVLAATLNFLGQDVGTVFIRLGQLSKTAHDNEAELNALGVATKDASGNFLNQVQILDSVRHALSGMEDGTKKARIEVLLFGGRGGLGQLIDLLQLTDEQVAALTSHFEEQGLIISEEQRKLGEEALRAGKDVDNAFTGLGTQLFTVVGPQIVAFLSSIATAISENAAKITEFVSGIVNTMLGLFQGLTGIAPEFDSITHSVENMNAPVSDSSFLLAELTTELDGLRKKLDPAKTATADFNAAINAQIKAIEGQIKAIDKSIGRLDHLADVELDAYRKINGALQAKIDLETEALDAEDRRISREQTAADLLRDQAQAYIDLAAARAEYQKDLADTSLTGPDRQGTLDRDVIAVADAAQKVRDVQEAISNNTRKIATEDRKVQIANLKAYVDDVEKIVTDSENKKAALNTLTKRKAKLEEEIAAATAKGATQEVTDLRVKLAAIENGIVAENKAIKVGAEISELDARKASLNAQKDALAAERATEAQINRTATLAAIKGKEAEIAAEKKRIAEAQKSAAIEKRLRDVNYADQVGFYSKTLPTAYDVARERGLAFAEDVKKALQGLHDLVVGADGKGGILGGIRDIAGALGDFGTILEKIAPSKGMILAGALALVIFGGPVGMGLGVALLALAGVEASGAIADRARDQSTKPGGFLEPYSATPGAGGDKNKAATDRAHIQLDYLSHQDPSSIYRDGNGKETVAAAIARLGDELAKGKFTRSGYRMGLSYVPHDNFPALLHRGEGVLTEAANLNRGGSRSGGGRTVTALIRGDEGEILDWIDSGLDRKRRR